MDETLKAIVWLFYANTANVIMKVFSLSKTHKLTTLSFDDTYTQKQSNENAISILTTIGFIAAIWAVFVIIALSRLGNACTI